MSKFDIFSRKGVTTKMAKDLKLANDLFSQAKDWARREYGYESAMQVDYFAVLAAAHALFLNPDLAEAFREETWLEPESAGA